MAAGGEGAFSVFAIGKLVEPLLLPVGVVCVLLLLVLLLSWRHRWGSRCLLLLTLALLWFCGSAYGPRLLLGPLERRHPIPPQALHAEAVVVLGGTVDLARSTAERIELYDRPERILEGVRLLQQGRANWLVFSGGSGDPLRPQVREADLLARIATRAGVSGEVLLLQGDSRTTYEDARYTAELLRKRGITTFFLVTSAFHMPRALACFRKQGTEPIPYPVDFRVEPPVASFNPYVPTANRLQLTSLALHEYYGWAVYWLQGHL